MPKRASAKLAWMNEEFDDPAPGLKPQNPLSPIPNDSGYDADDPEYPDIEDDESAFSDKKEDTFDDWKRKFEDSSKRGDPIEMQELLEPLRDRQLDPRQYKYVEDNHEIVILRQNGMISEASRMIRRMLKENLDQNLPATSLVRNLAVVLDQQPRLNECFIKILGAGAAKQDLHRKFLAGLIGAVQVGSGGDDEDLVYQTQSYNVQISTRFNMEWGHVILGFWNLNQKDPERFLKENELKRMQSGSPEERNILRKRLVVESIAEKYRYRSFFVTTVNERATIYHVGMDLGNLIISGFLSGRLSVEFDERDNREIYIDAAGKSFQIPDININYVRDVNSQPAFNARESLPFFVQSSGMIKLVADEKLLIEAMSTLEGLVFKEVPWTGNPNELTGLLRSHPSVNEIISRSST